MKIYKEIKITETKYVAALTLENGVILHAMEDGSADGSDGGRYYVVSKVVDDEIVVLGWSNDIGCPLHL